MLSSVYLGLVRVLLFNSLGKQTKIKRIDHCKCKDITAQKMPVRHFYLLSHYICYGLFFLFFCVLAPEGMNSIVFGKDKGEWSEGRGLF